MKSKSIFKIMLDLVLLVLYLQLMFWYGLSPVFHEVAGMAIGILFAFHVAVNWKPVMAMLSKARRGGIGVAKTVLLASDLILPPAMLVTIVTGMCIATEVWMTPANDTLVTIHNVFAYTCLFILILHTLLHASYLVGCCKQLMKGDIFQKAASCMGAASLVVSLTGVNILSGISNAGGLMYASAAAVSTKFIPAQMSDQSTAAAADTTVAGASPDPSAAAGSAAQTADATATDTAATDTTATDTTADATATDTTTEVVEEVTTDTTDDTTTTAVDQAYTADTVDTSNTPTNCTQCHRNCPITALSCNRGISWAQSNGYI